METRFNARTASGNERKLVPREYLSAAEISEDLLERFGVKHMFDFLDARVQGLRGIARQNRDFALQNDIAMIDLLVDVVDRYACPFLVSFKGLLPGFEAGKLW